MEEKDRPLAPWVLEHKYSTMYVITSCRSADSRRDDPIALFLSMTGFVYRYLYLATKDAPWWVIVDFGVHRTNEHEATNNSSFMK